MAEVLKGMGRVMKKNMERVLAVLGIAGLLLTSGGGTLLAAEPARSVSPKSLSDFDVLKGNWVRPDGGYVISIRDVDANGQLNASYANPNRLPFSKAQATRDGKTLRLFFEIRAGGYNGSTYTLAYDPAGDVLKGVYFQAVAQQKFDVYFVRAKR